MWKQSDLAALLDSVLRGFPIGSILVWDTDKKIESPPRIGPVEISPRPDGMVGYLLDGQQRVSTLAGTLRLTDDMDSIVDQIDWRVYYDLDEQAFIDDRKLTKDSDPRYFPVRSLLNTAAFFDACRRIQEKVDDEHRAQRWLDEADRLSSAFRDYQLPLIHIREADLESAVTVFARLNRTGRKMAADELVSALTYQEGEFHLASMLSKFKAELKKKGFGNLNRVFLLRSVLAALELDIYAKDWADLMVKSEVRKRLPEGFRRRHARHQIRAEDAPGSRRHFRPPAALWSATGAARRVPSHLPAAGSRNHRAAEALVLGDVVHGLVRWRQYHAGQARPGGNPEPCKGEERDVQSGRSGHAGAAFSRLFRRAKRPRTRIPAVPGVPSSSIAQRRCRSGSGAASVPAGHRRGRSPVVQARPARTDFQSRRTDCSWTKIILDRRWARWPSWTTRS